MYKLIAPKYINVDNKQEYERTESKLIYTVLLQYKVVKKVITF